MSWMIRQSCRASPGGVDRLVDLDDPALGLRRRSPRPPRAASRAARRRRSRAVSLRKKSIATKNSSFSSIRAMKSLSGSETTGLKQIRQQALDLAAVDLAEDLVGSRRRRAAARPASMPQTPATWRAVLRVLDVAAAGKLVALLAVLAAALAVALAGDRRVAAARPADPARGQHDVDRAQARSARRGCGARCRGRASGSWSSPCPTTRPPGGSPARRCRSPRPSAAASTPARARPPARSRRCGSR